MADLSITKRNVGNVVILDLVGRLTLGGDSIALRDCISAVVDGGSKKILANLVNVRYVDSSGLGELVSSFAMAARNGAVLKLVNMPQAVQGLLEMTKIVTVFETFEDETLAVRSFARARASAIGV